MVWNESQQVEIVWEERFDIQVCGDGVSLPAMTPVLDLRDPQGKTQRVVLTDGGYTPTAVLRRVVARGEGFDLPVHMTTAEWLQRQSAEAGVVAAAAAAPQAFSSGALGRSTAQAQQGGGVSLLGAPAMPPLGFSSPARLASLQFGVSSANAGVGRSHPGSAVGQSIPGPGVGREPGAAAMSPVSAIDGSNAPPLRDSVDKEDSVPAKRQRRRPPASSCLGAVLGSRRTSGAAAPPRKEDAASLSVSNIFSGVAKQPKVLLSWRRQASRLAEDKGQMSASDLFQERQTIDVLQASIDLLPEEVQSLSDEDYANAIRIIEPHVRASQMPLDIWNAWTLRAARKAQACRDADKVVELAWPWAEVGVGGSGALDGSQPRLRDLASCCAGVLPRGMSAVAECAFDIICKEYIAKLMMAKDGRKEEILRLAHLLGKAPAPAADAQPEEARLHTDMVTTSDALALFVQDSAATPSQIRSMRLLSEGIEKKSAEERSCVEALRVFLQDAWWVDARDRMWRFAADEGVAAPQIQKILSALKATPPSETDLEEAWTLAKERLPRWREKLRSTATSSVLETLRQHVVQQAELVTTSANREDASWQAHAARVGSRLDWLGEYVDVSAAREEVRACIEEAMSVRVMGTAMSCVRGFSTCSEDERPEAIQRISKAFEFQDTVVPLEHHEACRSLLEVFATEHAIIGTEMSQCGLVVAEALAFSGMVEGEANFTKVKAWKATVRAADLLAMVTSMSKEPPMQPTHDTASAPHAAAPSPVVTKAELVEECSTVLKAWKEEMDCGEDCLQWVLGNEVHAVKEAIARAQEEVAKVASKRAKPKREALEAALLRLSKFVGAADQASSAGSASSGEPSAGGGTACEPSPGGASAWKLKLSDTSSWEQVSREASYHLLSGGKDLHTILDEVSQEIVAKRNDLQAEADALDAAMLIPCGGVIPELFPAALLEKVSKATHEAEILHTESFFFSLLSSSAPDRTRKIQKRIESMSAHGISSDSIQPALWRKVLTVTSSARRAFPSTPVQKAPAQ